MFTSEAMNINLQDRITTNFKWYEAVYLPTWDVYVVPTDEQKEEIYQTCLKLESIRAWLNKPLKITSFLRPPIYNLTIGGSKNSFHCLGKAADFIPIGMDVNQAKMDIRQNGLLHTLDIRMENNGDGNWIHIDRGPVKHGRFFLP